MLGAVSEILCLLFWQGPFLEALCCILCLKTGCQSLPR